MNIRSAMAILPEIRNGDVVAELSQHIHDAITAVKDDIALNFKASKQVSYKGATRLQNGTVDIAYSEQVEGGAGPQGKINIPETFTVSIPVWAGLDQKKYELEARLRYRVGSGTLSIWYDLNRPHKIVESAFKDTLEQVEKSMGKTPIIFGKA